MYLIFLAIVSIAAKGPYIAYIETLAPFELNIQLCQINGECIVYNFGEFSNSEVQSSLNFFQTDCNTILT